MQIEAMGKVLKWAFPANNMQSEISCGAVVFRKEGEKILYLLLHYEKKHWDFPKGHVEKGESELETAVRETREETGITDLRFTRSFREAIHYYFQIGRKTVHKEVLYFLGETRTQEVILSKEHIGYVWLPYEEALGQITYENSKNVLRKANSFLKK